MINPVRPAEGLFGGLLSVQEVIVWFVDDDPGIRDCMRQLLAQPQMRLTRDFGSAEELLVALKAGPLPHVILLDFRLRGMSGGDAVAPIKEIAPDTHVIIFTSYFDFAKRDAALKAGATDYVLKRTPIWQLSDQILKLFRIETSPQRSGFAPHPIEKA